MFAKRTRAADNQGFTMVEIVFAVAIISVTFIGVTGIISLSGNQATKIEDEREMAELLLSVKTCVASFPIEYLREIADGRKTELGFGPNNASCLTGSSFTWDLAPEPSTKIVLKTRFWDGQDPHDREYWAHFETSTDWMGAKSVKAVATVEKWGARKSLDFRLDGK